MPRLSLVIPVYNEEPNLRPLLAEINEALAQEDYEVIFVNDGSRDGSAPLLEEMAAEDERVKVIQFRRNFGQTAAMQAGLDAASGEIIVTLDADRQNPPSEIPKLLAALTEDADMVAGYREKRHDEFKRVLISRIANGLISRVTGVRIRDNGCTLKAFRSWCVKDLRLFGEMHRFIPAHVHWMGGRIVETPVAHRPRVAGKSKYGWSRILKVLLDLLTVAFFQGYATKPAYLFGGMGLLFLLAGFSLSAITLYQKYVLNFFVHKNPLFGVASLFFVGGLQLLMMGLMGEVLMRTYYHSGNRHIYKVRRTVNLKNSPDESDSSHADV